jgi:serralysin
VINTGLIVGAMYLGSGNDVLDSHLGTLDGKVFAGAGNDKLAGGASDDYLAGDLGIDILTGNSGADAFHFAAGGKYNNDTITDFQHGIDHIELAHSYFTRLPAGALDPTMLRIGAAAADANDYLMYNSAGQLLYDADASGTAKVPFVIATLTGHPTLSASDIAII